MSSITKIVLLLHLGFLLHCGSMLWAADWKSRVQGLERLGRANEGHKDYVVKIIKKRLSELPKTHQVEIDAEISLNSGKIGNWHMFAMNADGKTDKESLYYHRTSVVRIVPFVNGLRHGLEQAGAFRVKEKKLYKKVIDWNKGKIHGHKKIYHKNGKLMLEVPYNMGKQEGESKTFDLTGRLKKKVFYKNGKKHGKMTEYWPLSGKVKKEIDYNMGLVEGMVKMYYDNGQLKKEVPVLKDEFHGIERQFDEEGNAIKVKYWIKDDVVSKSKFEKAFK